LQSDAPAREALDPSRYIGQILVKRTGASIAALNPESAVLSAIGRKPICRLSAEIMEECLVERMRVNVYDHVSCNFSVSERLK
jgi:hypothetical protein